MPSETGIKWLDRAVNSAELPDLADAGAALAIYNQVRRSDLSMHGFRRLPIQYRRVGKNRIYEVEHVVAAAKRKVLDAPLRQPAPRAPIKPTSPTEVKTQPIGDAEQARRERLMASSPRHR